MNTPRRFRSSSRELGVVALTMVLLIAFRVLFPVSWDRIATFDNLASVVRNMVFEGILALGMMLMLVGGMFDLSVGGMASMAGVITGWLMKQAGWPVPLAVATGLAVAALGGWVNGFIVAKVRVNALITTLGTMGVFSGIALLVGGPGITFLPASFSRLGQAEWLGLQAPIWLLAALALAGHYCLAHTRLFRQFYYIGANAKAARLSGIRVERLQMLAFTLMGLLAGLAGIVYASRVATTSSTIGAGKEPGRHHRGDSRRRQPYGRTGHRLGGVDGRAFHGPDPKHASDQNGPPRVAGHHARAGARVCRGRGLVVEPQT
jgi:ribose transport system permease protein